MLRDFLRLPSLVADNDLAAKKNSPADTDSTQPIAPLARKNLLSVPQPGPPAKLTPMRRPGTLSRLANDSRLGSQASAKPEEAVLADIAAQRHHAEAAQYKVEQSAMRPPDIVLFALGTFHSHGLSISLHHGELTNQIFDAPYTALFCTMLPSPGSATIPQLSIQYHAPET
jgi:hypothetical protein